MVRLDRVNATKAVASSGTSPQARAQPRGKSSADGTHWRGLSARAREETSRNGAQNDPKGEHASERAHHEGAI